MYDRLEPFLADVRKPARYVGGECNAVMKDKDSVDLRVTFCFPDTYEIGMSHLGLQILYGLMNEKPWIWCERAFAPWTDMEEVLRRENIELYALESGDALSKFDILAFTLQYELCYTNLLNMLALSNIPLKSSDRKDSYPLIIAGGPCAYNPEPLADFIDLFVLGDGEEVTIELMELIRKCKKDGVSKTELLRKAALIGGVYVPSLYEVTYNEDNTIKAVTSIYSDVPKVVTKRVVEDLDKSFYPTKPPVPCTEIVHERTMLELFRGCIRGCRFCQAGFTTRPVRSRSKETLAKQAIETCNNTGYEEISLTSLSSSDYTPLEALCENLLEFAVPKRIGLSLPSLRADSFTRGLMEKVQSVRKSGLTFAPEAGTARLRDVINKNLTEEALFSACESAFDGGWTGVKLYFMLGLPTETLEDVIAIPDLAHRIFLLWRRTTNDKARGVRVSASASCFVPKPQTPFQWVKMDTIEMFNEKISALKSASRKQVTLNWHDPKTSHLEGVFARGDRRLGAVIEKALSKGARMDGWSENFSHELWMNAFSECGIDPSFYVYRERSKEEILPWEHLSVGISKDYLWSEYRKAVAEESTPDCRSACSGCGADCFGGECHVV